MPTPESMRIYHAKIKEQKGVSVIDDGDVLVETIAPWQTWIGKPGKVEHSTKAFPPERFRVPQEMAEHLVAGNAVVIVEEPTRKRGRPKKTKAMRPEEDKSIGGGD